MTENNLKLWTCYPKKVNKEHFNNSKDDDCDYEEYSASETYDNASEDFENIPNNSWKCVASNNIENFQMSDYEIQQNLDVTTSQDRTTTESEGVNTESEGVTTDYKSNPNKIKNYIKKIKKKNRLLKQYFFGNEDYSDYYYYISMFLLFVILMLIIRG
jgi:hypothetical protein